MSELNYNGGSTKYITALVETIIYHVGTRWSRGINALVLVPTALAQKFQTLYRKLINVLYERIEL